MIDISKIETYGWDGAMRGMRNSRESWEKGDTCSGVLDFNGRNIWLVGENDLELASKLARFGGSHSKFRRMIHAQMDILAPLYWWKEFDTYKVGTTANSTSTMYSIMKKKFDISDFSAGEYTSAQAGMHMIATVDVLNELRDLYLDEEHPGIKKMFWQDVICILPSSYNQLRTVDLNYEVIAHMVEERIAHKLPEWQEFCLKLLKELPYAKQLIFDIQEANDDWPVKGTPICK